MHFTILTLFPEMFQGAFSHSILKNAQKKDLFSINFINIRDFGIGNHQTVDDTPYGGGAGMVLRVDVLYDAIQKARESYSCKKENQKVILLDAGGETFTQKKAQNLATQEHIIFVCGHYEGVDERIKEYVDMELSIGDYVVTGGEIPTMVIVDAVARLLPGVIKEDSSKNESFSLESGHLEYPHYTKPDVFKQNAVPEVLLSGNHKAIDAFRKDQSKKKTQKIRPDLIKKD